MMTKKNTETSLVTRIDYMEETFGTMQDEMDSK